MADEAPEPSVSDRLKQIRKAPPPFRRLTVQSIESLSPYMRRVVVGGSELEGFTIPSAASSVRVLVPAPGVATVVLPTWTGNQFETADGERAPIRTFTPRAQDASGQPPTLTLDVVLHDHGVVTDWVRSASIGDEVAMSGPGRDETIDPAARSHLLAGDESAIPAIAQLLESIPHDHAVEVHIEIRAADARIDLPGHPNATVTWHENDGVERAPGHAMADAVNAVTELPDAVWVAGEAAAVQRLRTHLFDERGRERSSVTARGYWKHGRSGS